jgi:hypothetical protein
MSVPRWRWPAVATGAPPLSAVARSKEGSGCRSRALAGLVEDVLQGAEARRGAAAAEVASRRGARDAAGAQGIEEDFVVAAQLDVVEAAALTQGVVGDVEGVLGFVIGQVDLEQVQPLVDGLWEPQVAGQRMGGANATVGKAAGAVCHLVVDRAGR